MLLSSAVMNYVVAILGLAVLMVVHEAGHYFAARAGGLRVTKFSIGFGPTLFKVQPENGHWTFSSLGDRLKFKLWRHSSYARLKAEERGGEGATPYRDAEAEAGLGREANMTVFHVAVIPFLAYVQIAGMNPLEEQDPADKGSYANASLKTRRHDLHGASGELPRRLRGLLRAADVAGRPDRSDAHPGRAQHARRRGRLARRRSDHRDRRRLGEVRLGQDESAHRRQGRHEDRSDRPSGDERRAQGEAHVRRHAEEAGGRRPREDRRDALRPEADQERG